MNLSMTIWWSQLITMTWPVTSIIEGEFACSESAIATWIIPQQRAIIRLFWCSWRNCIRKLWFCAQFIALFRPSFLHSPGQPLLSMYSGPLWRYIILRWSVFPWYSTASIFLLATFSIFYITRVLVRRIWNCLLLALDVRTVQHDRKVSSIVFTEKKM